MSKRKHGPTIVPALSAEVYNKEKRFIQVGNSLLLSKQFHVLDLAEVVAAALVSKTVAAVPDKGV